MLAPIVFGTGVKIKILDALAHGVPVIGTGAAFDGVPRGPHFVIEDDLDRWGEHMRRVADAEINAAMSASAWETYDAELSPAVVREQYRRVFDPREVAST